MEMEIQMVHQMKYTFIALVEQFLLMGPLTMLLIAVIWEELPLMIPQTPQAFFQMEVLEG
jgi:hypothetical protein